MRSDRSKFAMARRRWRLARLRQAGQAARYLAAWLLSSWLLIVLLWGCAHGWWLP